MFCPKSNTNTPGFTSVIFFVGSVCTTFCGGNICALSTPPGDLTASAVQLASSA